MKVFFPKFPERVSVGFPWVSSGFVYRFALHFLYAFSSHFPEGPTRSLNRDSCAHLILELAPFQRFPFISQSDVLSSPRGGSNGYHNKDRIDFFTTKSRPNSKSKTSTIIWNIELMTEELPRYIKTYLCFCW